MDCIEFGNATLHRVRLAGYVAIYRVSGQAAGMTACLGRAIGRDATNIIRFCRNVKESRNNCWAVDWNFLKT